MSAINSYNIHQFQQQVDDCLDAVEKQPSENRWERLRQLIASTPLSVSEQAKKRIFSLNMPVAAFSQTVELVEAQTGNHWDALLPQPFMSALFSYMPEERAKLANVSKSMLNYVDKEKVDLINKNPHQSLQELGFKEIPSVLHFLSRQTTRVKSLDLKEFKITRSDLKMIIEKRTPLLSLVLPPDLKITVQECAVIAKEFKLLKALHLSGCERIVSLGVSALLRGLTQLQTLDLDGCKQIPEWEMVDYVINMKNLESLSIGGSSLISESRVASIIKGLPRLRFLGLSHCSLITDGVLSSIATQVPLLTGINLSHCLKITYEGIDGFCKRLPQLKAVDLSGNHQIVWSQFSALRFKHPGIKFIR